jgi:tetratricopeptide (TPR) repeat protein
LEYLKVIDLTHPDWHLPGGVRALLHQRLQLPGEATRQLLAAAAVIGRAFDFKILQSVSGRSEWEIVAGLEELVNYGLVREQSGGRYDFSHDKLRTVSYEETSAARRQLLHKRAGEAIAASGHAGYDSSAWAGLAANHFLHAGQSDRAAELFLQAGDQARLLHANSEALEAYQAALAAGHPDPSGLHEACGDLFVLLGNYREAVNSYQAATAFCTPACLSNLMHKLGEVYLRRGEWEAAEGHYRAALDAAGEDGSPAWLTHLFTDWSLTAYRSGQMDRARHLANQALKQAHVANDSGALAQAHNMLGILAQAAGALEEAGTFFEASLESARRLNDPVMRYAALNNLARLLQERGQAVKAIPLARQSLELCAQMGDRHRQAAIHNNLADLYHAAGMEEEAMAELKQAVALFAEIGENAGAAQPEIWKLTEW